MSLRHTIDYFTAETGIMPGLAVACGDRRHAAADMGGVINRQGTPLTEKSLFDLASLTKLFTGLLVIRLKEEGTLDLSRRVTDYAPEFTHLQGVTVDQVLGFEVSLATPERLDQQACASNALRVLHQIVPGDNGDSRAYSDMHAMVLSRVLAGASGMTWEALLQQKILHPLGMEETFTVAPENRHKDLVQTGGEHRIISGRYILRPDAPPGVPHDPKAALMYPECFGHAGVFSTLPDMIRLCQGLLAGKVISPEGLRFMSCNRTGRKTTSGAWTQFLGSQCYVKHPDQYFSEIPVYESSAAIGLSGFTGHHLSVDVETGVFALMLGNRVLDRLTTVTLLPGQSLADLGLRPDGTGQVCWPDGSKVFSSVDYVHHKDAHFHRQVAQTLGLSP